MKDAQASAGSTAQRKNLKPNAERRASGSPVLKGIMNGSVIGNWDIRHLPGKPRRKRQLYLQDLSVLPRKVKRSNFTVFIDRNCRNCIKSTKCNDGNPVEYRYRLTESRRSMRADNRPVSNYIPEQQAEHIQMSVSRAGFARYSRGIQQIIPLRPLP